MENNLNWIVKDKFLRWFYLILIALFGVVYYFGQERNRRLEEQGFSLCYIKGRDTWVHNCVEDKNFIEKLLEN